MWNKVGSRWFLSMENQTVSSRAENNTPRWKLKLVSGGMTAAERQGLYVGDFANDHCYFYGRVSRS